MKNEFIKESWHHGLVELEDGTGGIKREFEVWELKRRGARGKRGRGAEVQ